MGCNIKLGRARHAILFRFLIPLGYRQSNVSYDCVVTRPFIPVGSIWWCIYSPTLYAIFAAVFSFFLLSELASVLSLFVRVVFVVCVLFVYVFLIGSWALYMSERSSVLLRHFLSLHLFRWDELLSLLVFLFLTVLMCLSACVVLGSGSSRDHWNILSVAYPLLCCSCALSANFLGLVRAPSLSLLFGVRLLALAFAFFLFLVLFYLRVGSFLCSSLRIFSFFLLSFVLLF